MAELRKAVATREETVVNDVATRMDIHLRLKEQKAIVLRFVKVKKC